MGVHLPHMKGHHDSHHEGWLPLVQLASAYGKLGNIDANTGDAQTGWDTDQFLTDPKEALLVAATILKQGGMAPGDSRTSNSVLLVYGRG